MTKEERIEKLRAAISSSATPAHIKEQMRSRIAELERPAPPPPPPAPKKVEYDWNSLPHVKYMAENNITISEVPMPIRKKINGLRLFVGGDSEAKETKAPEISSKIAEMIRKHKTPPRAFQEGEKQALLEKYKARRERINQNQI